MKIVEQNNMMSKTEENLKKDEKDKNLTYGV